MSSVKIQTLFPYLTWDFNLVLSCPLVPVFCFFLCVPPSCLGTPSPGSCVSLVCPCSTACMRPRLTRRVTVKLQQDLVRRLSRWNRSPKVSVSETKGQASTPAPTAAADVPPGWRGGDAAPPGSGGEPPRSPGLLSRVLQKLARLEAAVA